MAEYLEQLGQLIVRQRVRISIMVIGISLLSIAGILNRINADGLPIDFTPQAIFFDKSPQMERLKQIEQTFGREDNDYLVLLRGSLSTEQGKDYIEELHTSLGKADNTIQIDSLVSAVTPVGELGLIEVINIWEEEDVFERAKAIPEFRRALISEDGDTIVIRVRIDSTLLKVSEISPVIDHLNSIVEANAPPEAVEVYTTGVPYIRAEVVQMMIDDESFYLPVTAFLFTVIICFLFRAIWVSLAPLVAVNVAILWSMGILFSAGVTFNILSILVPVLSLVIGVADGIHVVSRYREELQNEQNPELAMGRTLRHMALPCFLTTFTTSAGFLSLLVANTVVIKDFGLHSAIAIATAFIVVMLIVPLWLAFIPAHRIGKPATQSPREDAFFRRIDSFVYARPTPTILFSLVLIIAALWVGKDVKVNSSILEMYSDDHPTHKALSLAEKELSGVVPLFVHVESKEDVLDPEILTRLDRIQKKLEDYALVRWTWSYNQQISTLHKLLGGEGPQPTTRNAIAQELLFVESSDLPLDRILSEDRRQARLMALCTDAGGPEFIKLYEDISSELEREFADRPDLRVELTGDGLMASIGINRLVHDLLYSLLLVFAVIVAVMYLLLRDLRLTIIASVPNAIPLVFTLAALLLMGSDLQTSNIVSFTVAVGLAVDDTIHFIVRYNQERKSGTPHKLAMTNTFLGAGHAIVLTSLLLVGGFGFLGTSDLTTTYHFGVLAAVTLASAVFADLFFLPACLHLNQRAQAYRKEAKNANAG